jgi:probable F420-dependent oxidoreductase
MKLAVILPTMPDGANPEGIEAAAETAERLGWASAWTTDHLIVPHATAADYGTIYDVITTLAWVGARHTSLRLGTSVIVVPMRNAVVLAKELATLDSLVGGRVVAGVGVGWNEVEFGNVGVADVFHSRGRYLDETIRLWRHLWSGSTEPFLGQFHRFSDFTFGPLPAQGASLPIVIGGRSDAAIRRAATLGDGFHASSLAPEAFGEKIAQLREGLAAAGRPPIPLSGRVGVRFGEDRPGGFVIAGSPAEMLATVREYEALGLEELAFAFGETDAERVRTSMERFDRDVLAAVR